MLLDRPDAILSDSDGRVFFVEEDKCEDIELAKKQLDKYVQHLFKFDKEVSPSQIFGCTIVYKEAILWLYQRNDMRNGDTGYKENQYSCSAITAYKLADVKERIRMATNILCLYVICENESNKFFEKKLHEQEIQRYSIVERPTGYTQKMYENQFLKVVYLDRRIKIMATASKNGLDDLKQLYRLLQSPDNLIVNTVKCVGFKFEPTQLFVVYSPFCDTDFIAHIKNVDDLKKVSYIIFSKAK